MIFRLPNYLDGGPGLNVAPNGAAHEEPAVRFTPDGAVPGDRIVGILEAENGITIYPIQSPALTAYDDEPDRWIDVRWDLDSKMTQRYPARIRLNSLNEPGALAEIAETIALNDANIHNLNLTAAAPDVSSMVMDLEVWDLQHLTRTINQLRGKACVTDVVRVNG